MNTVSDLIGEQLALFDAPKRLWRGGRAHPRSLAKTSAVDGGAFCYDACPRLFFGREGVGPLRVAMDTAVLIDYGEYGAAIWSDQAFDPPVSETRYRSELFALETLMQIWLTRDIRFHVFESQLTDARREMTGVHAELRERQIVQLQSALECLGHDTDQIDPAEEEAWPDRPDLTDVANGHDRAVLADAVEAGCHIFLTRDRALIRKANRVARFWVAVMSPAGLLDGLAEADELSRFGVGSLLAADSHKWCHVMGACTPVGE